ncbi:MAG: DMT family transporter [Lachnospiraceae bacterium]|nr:DMT family transporter [Lachnospiraceae bacterium]
MNQKHQGMICIILSAFSFALMNVFVRMAGDVPSMQKSFFRNLLCFFFALAIMKKQHVGFSGKKENIGALLARSVFGTIGILCNFYAVDHMVLADASMLNKMSPFFAILFSFLLLKEKIKPVQLIAVIGAFLGSLLIIKPTGIGMARIPALIGLCGGLGAGVAYTFVRVLSTRGEKGPFIVCFFSGFSTLCLLPVMLVSYTPMSGRQLACLLLAGLAACGGQFGITAAYFHAPAREISIFDYSQIVFSAVFGFFLFGQIPDGYSFLGYVIVCGMALWMFFYQQREARREFK